jgi:caa(3)-type oxidase subunit IV
MEPIKKMLEGYKMYLITFVALSILTLLAVGLSQVRISSPFVIGLILFIAIIQASIVLFYNMHLKFHDKILTIFVGAVFFMIIAIIIITMVDFVNR